MVGLCDTCKLLRKVSIDDGFGGVKSGTATVKSSVRCRQTRLDANDESRNPGIGGQDVWRFSTEYIDIDRAVGDVKILYVIEFGGVLYDVLWWQYRRDEFGAIDHIEFRTEKR